MTIEEESSKTKWSEKMIGNRIIKEKKCIFVLKMRPNNVAALAEKFYGFAKGFFLEPSITE